jgi:hypothetical protein
MTRYSEGGEGTMKLTKELELKKEQVYQKRRGEVLKVLTEHPEITNKQLAVHIYNRTDKQMYRAIQRTTARMQCDNLITGRIVQWGKFSTTVWRVIESSAPSAPFTPST